MRKSILQNHMLPAAIIVAGFTCLIFLSGFISNVRPQMPDDYEDTDLSMNGSRLRGFAFGMEGLMADWYYVRSLQYIGYKLLHSKSDFINVEDLRDLNPRLLYPLLENATDLDPHFIAAYSYGAIVLPAIDPEKAVALATKGINNNPNEWRLYQHLGYIYWRLKQYDKAWEIYERGSQIENAAPFMKVMSAAMKTAGGSRETARIIYREMLSNPPDEQIKITARRKLEQIDSFEERELIDKALADFQEKNGRCPNGLQDILPMLMKQKLPEGRDFRIDKMNNLVDPTDAPYLLDKKTCTSQLDAEKTGIALQ
jgi:tetratricopeptide (TPR) repeat protein